ncbi:hypothetical protein SASPL_156011 [Salvia splendens]|uniref:Uncharacterized protein n=1 Tax=Salvia splendens TaxID=180675 RepID=A0A8X8VXI7_SALSN|nr:hypothetical protein SASPL_156011 [Salvia splendens]
MSIVPAVCFFEPVVPLRRAYVDVGGEVVERELDVWIEQTQKLASTKRTLSVQLGKNETRRGNHVQNTMIPKMLRPLSGTLRLERRRRNVWRIERLDRIELPVVEFGGEVGEEAVGDGEHREVLEIGVVIEAVARDVVRVVRPLPPRNADAGEAVFENVGEETVAAEDAVEAGGEEEGDEAEAVDHAVAFLLEHSGSGELRREGAVIARHFRDVEVAEVVAGEETVQVLPGGARVEGDECVGDVLASEIEKRNLAAGVALRQSVTL